MNSLLKKYSRLQFYFDFVMYTVGTCLKFSFLIANKHYGLHTWYFYVSSNVHYKNLKNLQYLSGWPRKYVWSYVAEVENVGLSEQILLLNLSYLIKRHCKRIVLYIKLCQINVVAFYIDSSILVFLLDKADIDPTSYFKIAFPVYLSWSC